MEEEDRKNHPSLPSTYVTLVQLQERWLQDKQRKQREEEERKQKSEKEEEEKTKREEEEKANLQRRQRETITLSRSHRLPFRKNHWIQSDRISRTIGGKAEISQCGAIVVNDRELNTDDLKKKNMGKNWNIRRKPMAEKDLTGGTEQLFLEKEDLIEKTPVVSTERDCENEGVTSEFQSVEVGRKCEGVSASGAKGGNVRYDRVMKIWGNKRGKHRVEKDLTGCTEHLVLEGEDEAAKVPLVLTEKRCGKEGVTSEFRSVEIGKKCEGAATSGGKEGNWRYGRGKKNKGKHKAGEDLTRGKEHLVPGNEDETEKSVVVSKEKGCGKKGVTGEFPSMEIGHKCEGVSASGGKGGNGTYAWGMKNRGNKRGKPRAEEDLAIGTEQLLPKNEVEAEKIQVVSTERDCEFEQNGKKLLANGWVWEKKVVTLDRSVETLGKFKDLSVRRGKGGNERNAWNVNGGQRRYDWGSESYNSRRLQSPRDSNLVWVRKGEGDTSDANVFEDQGISSLKEMRKGEPSQEITQVS